MTDKLIEPHTSSKGEQRAPSTILLVDDSKVIRRAASKALEQEYWVLEAGDGQEAWELLLKHDEIGIVFSDISMPRMDGFELLKRVRSSENVQLAKLPVVIITGREEQEDCKREMMALGATDFITKPFDTIRLKSRARTILNYSAKVVELESKTIEDAVTGLYNARYFTDQGRSSLSYAVRHRTDFTLLRFELQNLESLIDEKSKKINEVVLKQVGDAVRKTLRREDMAAYLDNGQFAAVIPGTNRIGGKRVIERLKEAITAFGQNNISYPAMPITACFGFSSPLVSQELQFDTLVTFAEEALGKARQQGPGSYAYHDGRSIPDLNQNVSGNTEAAVAVEKEKAAEVPQQAEKQSERVKKVEAVETDEQGLDVNMVVMKAAHRFGSHLGDLQIKVVLRTMLPFLELADRRLKLGMGDVIKSLRIRLGV